MTSDSNPAQTDTLSHAGIKPAQLCIAPGLRAGRPLGFHKSEKLRHRSLVNALFDNCDSIYAWPLRLVWRKLKDDELDRSFRSGAPEGIGRVQFLVTIPKKRCRRAVDRVLMRRRVREAYRLNRRLLEGPLSELPETRTISLAFVYIADKVTDSRSTGHAMEKLLAKLADRLVTQKEVGNQ